jgi:hypothetical protein
VKNDFFTLIISPVLIAELLKAPEAVQEILSELPKDALELMEHTEEISYLRDEYLKEKVLSFRSKADSEHVASATIGNADFIISWNFKHIVHFDKISGFNAVNLKNGYKLINIYSPKEVV